MKRNRYQSVHDLQRTRRKVMRSIDDGDSAIGPPTPKPGERITLDRDGRYWIEDDA